MPRTRKTLAAATTPETAEAGIKEIINTSIEKTVEEAATYVNVANFKLRDMFCDRLENDSPLTWETIPTEHEPLLEEFKRQMDAAATVQPYQLPQAEQQPEPPVLEDEPKESPSDLATYTENPVGLDIHKELLETQELKEEATQAIDFLFQAEEDQKAQLVAAVKQHGWAVYEQLGADLDTAKILEIAQERLSNSDKNTNSRLASARERLGLKSSAQLKAEIEAKRQSFFAQQQRRQQTWEQATSLKSNN